MLHTHADRKEGARRRERLYRQRPRCAAAKAKGKNELSEGYKGCFAQNHRALPNAPPLQQRSEACESLGRLALAARAVSPLAAASLSPPARAWRAACTSLGHEVASA